MPSPKCTCQFGVRSDCPKHAAEAGGREQRRVSVPLLRSHIEKSGVETESSPDDLPPEYYLTQEEWE